MASKKRIKIGFMVNVTDAKAEWPDITIREDCKNAGCLDSECDVCHLHDEPADEDGLCETCHAIV